MNCKFLTETQIAARAALYAAWIAERLELPRQTRIPRARLAALRAAEMKNWIASGGDFLARKNARTFR